jgi:hypothetical protein
VRTDRLNPEQMDRDVLRILELVVEVRHVWEQAVDGGVYSPRLESNGRGKGFQDSDPTHSAVTRPTQWQLRGSARRAAVLISEAKDRLEDAAWVLHNGMLRTDPDEWIQHREKRAAAIQGHPAGRSKAE